MSGLNALIGSDSVKGGRAIMGLQRRGMRTVGWVDMVAEKTGRRARKRTSYYCRAPLRVESDGHRLF